VPPWRLLGKRLLGQANLWLNRGRRFDLRLLAQVLRRAVSLQPDLMLLSGDLTSTALDAEFKDVAEVFATLGSKPPLVIVPGNHDRYTFAATRRRSLERIFADAVPLHFPHMRRLSATWQLLALDASVPRLMTSRGRLGKAQLGEARTLIEPLTAQDGLVVLCHYPFTAPPEVKMPWEHRLADASDLRDLLASSNAPVLLLHGHVHQPWCWRPPDPHHCHVVNLNCGSPTLRDGNDMRGHGFWQIDLPDNSNAGVVLIHHEPAPVHGLNLDEAWVCHRVQ